MIHPFLLVEPPLLKQFPIISEDVALVVADPESTVLREEFGQFVPGGGGMNVMDDVQIVVQEEPAQRRFLYNDRAALDIVGPTMLCECSNGNEPHGAPTNGHQI